MIETSVYTAEVFLCKGLPEMIGAGGPYDMSRCEPFRFCEAKNAGY